MKTLVEDGRLKIEDRRLGLRQGYKMQSMNLKQNLKVTKNYTDHY